MDVFDLNDETTLMQPVIAQAASLPDAEFNPAELDYNLCTAEIRWCDGDGD